MGIYADLGRAIADHAEQAQAVRVLVSDPESGVELRGVITEELSSSHVRLRAEDGLIFAVAKADIIVLGRLGSGRSTLEQTRARTPTTTSA